MWRPMRVLKQMVTSLHLSQQLDCEVLTRNPEYHMRIACVEAPAGASS